MLSRLQVPGRCLAVGQTEHEFPLLSTPALPLPLPTEGPEPGCPQPLWDLPPHPPQTRSAGDGAVFTAAAARV